MVLHQFNGNAPLHILGCQGLELLNWFGGQLQQMQDEMLAEDVLRGSEGAPDAMRDKILAELFGINTPKRGKCCATGKNTEAAQAKCADQTLPKHPTNEKEAKKAEPKEKQDKGKRPQLHDGLGILGWFNEHLSKMEEELFKDEPSTSSTTESDIRSRVAEKLRSRREKEEVKEQGLPKQHKEEGKEDKQAETNTSEVEKESSVKEGSGDDEVQVEKPQTESDTTVTSPLLKDSDDEQMILISKDQEPQQKSEPPNMSSTQSSEADFWTPRRVDDKNKIEWHFGGDSWFEPEDVKVDVDGRNVTLAVSRKEIGRKQEADRESDAGEFTSYREMRQTLTLPETVDASKLEARFVPESRTIVLTAPRIQKFDDKNDGLVPIRIIRKNQISPQSK